MSRWDPWTDLFTIQNEVERLLNGGWSGGASAAAVAGSRPQAVSLPLDIRQTDQAFVIEASVPGFRPEQVEITVEQGILTIQGQRPQEEPKDGVYLRRERGLQAFFRQLTLPGDVREEGIAARFEHGVLTVTVPRAESAQPRRIQVQSSAALPAPGVVDAPAVGAGG